MLLTPQFMLDNLVRQHMYAPGCAGITRPDWLRSLTYAVHHDPLFAYLT